MYVTVFPSLIPSFLYYLRVLVYKRFRSFCDVADGGVRFHRRNASGLYTKTGVCHSTMDGCNTTPFHFVNQVSSYVSITTLHSRRTLYLSRSRYRSDTGINWSSSLRPSSFFSPQSPVHPEREDKSQHLRQTKTTQCILTKGRK